MIVALPRPLASLIGPLPRPPDVAPMGLIEAPPIPADGPVLPCVPALDVALPLEAAGDETDFELSGLKFHALFVPGHSFDHTVYMTELNGRRIAFSADLGFENQDILNRCWGDAEKARTIVQVIRDRLVPWHPDVVFTGHGVRPDGTGFLTELIRHTEASLAQLSATPKK